MSYPWYPGEDMVGSKVSTAPQVDTQKHVFQKGIATGGPAWSPPSVTTPGTVATGGTVTNSTGYDAMVYASATTGISSVKLGTAVMAGSALSGQTVAYYLYAGNTITVDYTGTLTWNWLAV